MSMSRQWYNACAVCCDGLNKDFPLINRNMTHIHSCHAMGSLVHSILSLTGEGHAFDEWTV